jgi:hypothetical protein
MNTIVNTPRYTHITGIGRSRCGVPEPQILVRFPCSFDHFTHDWCKVGVYLHLLAAIVQDASVGKRWNVKIDIGNGRVYLELLDWRDAKHGEEVLLSATWAAENLKVEW